MAGGFPTQQPPEMEDETMRDTSMLTSNDSPFYDPMDISPIPIDNNQQPHQPQLQQFPQQQWQSTDFRGTGDSPEIYPSLHSLGFLHKYPYAPIPRELGKAATPLTNPLTNPPRIRAPFIRPITRFSPRSHARPIYGIARPGIGILEDPFKKEPGIFERYSKDRLRLLLGNPKPNFRNALQAQVIDPATRGSSFNSFLTNKSTSDGKMPSFASNTSVSTAESSDSRKRSIDDGSNDQSHNTTPEVDSRLNTKYRCVSKEGFPASAIVAHDESNKAPADEANVGQNMHFTRVDQPAAPSMEANVTIQSQEFVRPRFNFKRGTLFEREMHRADFFGTTPSTNMMPGGWPDQTPIHYRGHVAHTANRSLTSGPFNGMPSSTSAIIEPSLAEGHDHDHDHHANDMDATHNPEQLPTEQRPSALRTFRASLYEATMKIYTEKIAPVLRSTFTLAGSLRQRTLGLFGQQQHRRPRPSHLSPSTNRASPALASLRTLPDAQRQRIRSNRWRTDRGQRQSTAETNYPFPRLSLNLPEPVAGPSSQIVDSPVVNQGTIPSENPIETSKHEHKRADKKRRTATSSVSSPKNAKHKSSRSGSAIEKNAWVQPMSPNMQRRILPPSFLRRNPERVREEILWQTARNNHWGVELPPRDVPKKDHTDADRQAEPKAAAEASKSKKQRKVRFEEPQSGNNNSNDKPVIGTEEETLLTELAPYLNPSPDSGSAIADMKPSEKNKLSDEQKENVPPTNEGLLEVSEVSEVSPADHVSDDDDDQPWVDPWQQPPEFFFGRPLSAVSLFYPNPQPLPPGRTESIYAARWREIEEEEKRKERQERPTRIKPEGAAVRPLPENWTTRVSDAMKMPATRKVATTLSGDPLTKKDLFTCYKPMEWLNDEVINSYLALIVDYLRRINDNAGRHDKPRYHAFNSFFFSNLRDKGYSSVRRWASRAKIGGGDLLNVDTVFIPVHNNHHWTLIVVKPMERTIENFDSLGTVSRRHVAAVKEWLKAELGNKWVEDEWNVLPSISPQQNNGTDCGVFLLTTAKAVAIGLDPCAYGAQDIVLLRRKIVGELMNGGLEGDFNPTDEGGEVLL